MKMGKVEKRVGNLYNEKGYVVHKINLKQALNHGLVLKKCMFWPLNTFKKLG